jgi:hypothetical protein
MSHFRSYVIPIFAAGTLFLAFALWLPGQTRGAKIELKGMPSQINQSAGTFVMESLTITTTPETRYEDRRDHHVDQAAFFSDLHESDRVEVEGRLQGNTITARKIEIEDHW